MEPRVSVVLPVYNAEQHLEIAIKSILDQGYTDFELIIINDGSTDNSGQIIDRFAGEDGRIKIIQHKKNRGLIPSLNEGIDKARGEYIARQDADDISAEDRLARQVVFLDSHKEIGMIGTNYFVIDKSGRTLGATDVFTNPADIKLGMVICNQMGHGTVMIRRDSLRGERYDIHYKSAEDYDLWSRLARKVQITNLKEPLYYWRQHQESVSAKDAAEMDRQRFAIRDREFNYYLQHKNKYSGLSFHPFSIRGGLKAYLQKKNTLCRDLGLLYSWSGQYSTSLTILSLGMVLAPWQKKTYRQIFITVFQKNRLSSVSFEYL